jgi:hypothetical protein
MAADHGRLEPACCCGDLLRVAKPGPCRCERRGPNTPPAFQTKVTPSASVGDDRTDDCAFGGDDVVCLGPCSENYVFRGLMTCSLPSVSDIIVQ